MALVADRHEVLGLEAHTAVNGDRYDMVHHVGRLGASLSFAALTQRGCGQLRLPDPTPAGIVATLGCGTTALSILTVPALRTLPLVLRAPWRTTYRLRTPWVLARSSWALDGHRQCSYRGAGTHPRRIARSQPTVSTVQRLASSASAASTISAAVVGFGGR